MYVVTFYSYKGGVGRTMALVNVAAGLAQAGKRVLLVDFDLEAPGLPTFDILGAARGHQGIVDFIQTYRNDLVAPDVADYIVRCDSDGASVWLMPAGDNSSPSYAERLNSIDWEDLYARQNGYLLLDDLKQQWQSYEGVGFDYVLIDSRTGHTDVGGICTRQLPNAVVIMFLPNDQNVDGLIPIVGSIRNESILRREAAEPGIELHFCPSNIPDEYDEDGILGGLLDTASRKLGYHQGLLENAGDRSDYKDGLGPEQPAAVIRHRTSLSLLVDPLIVRSKLGARLTKEYDGLRQAIEARNFADKDGALLALTRLPERFERAQAERRRAVRGEFVKEAEEIRRRHPRDPDVATKAAELFRTATDFELEANARTIAIENGQASARTHLARAIARLNTDNDNGAGEDLIATLKSHDGRSFEFVPAVQLLHAAFNDPLPIVRDLFLSRTTPLGAKKLLSPMLMTDRDSLQVVAEECLGHADELPMGSDYWMDLFGVASLALIGSRQYSRAIEVAARLESAEGDRRDGRIAIEFNRCVASWGLSGQPSIERFAELDQKISAVANPDANSHQCFALVASVLGNRDKALQELGNAERKLLGGRLQFSCWNYLYVEDEAFEIDIQEMRNELESGATLTPAFFLR